MKDILDVLGWLGGGASADAPLALATVVKTDGPAYRRAGARMLVAGGRRAVGAISGGCLEQDICERASRLKPGSAPTLVAYDSRGDVELVWGPATGCGGVVWVLLEDLSAPDSSAHLTAVEGYMRRRETCVLATIIGGPQDSTTTPGTHVVFGEDLAPAGPFAEGARLEALRAGAADALARDRTTVRSFEAEGLEVLFEVVRPPLRLAVYGGGHGARPLVRFAAQLGWPVTVVEHRPAHADACEFPEAERVLLARPEEAVAASAPDARTAAVVMTHNFNHDASLLRGLLRSPAPYVGLLGARARAEKILEHLRDEEAFEPGPAERARLYAPAGLSIHSETPEEVALSIVAEIQAVTNGRTGGPLRDHSRSIHDR